ncbi:MAG: hypothetical protein ACTH31_16420, partial [Pseudoclavibacter sp.]
LSAEYIPTLSSDDAKAGALATLEATAPLLEPADGAPRFENLPGVWESMVAFMGDNGLLGETTVTADESFTNDFVPGE